MDLLIDSHEYVLVCVSYTSVHTGVLHRVVMVSVLVSKIITEYFVVSSILTGYPTRMSLH